MSRVFVATESAFGRSVVVKVLLPELSEGVSAERFKREIAVAAKLQHPHIVPLLSAGESGGVLFYTMPFIAGESLRDRLQRTGELPLASAVRVLRDVASALAYAHRQGIVHRDIKPENILFSDDRAVVTDFGIAKAISVSKSRDGGATLTQLGTSLGTPAYMSPEQVVGESTVDHRADIYALGVVAYELLTGGPPFEGRPAQALMQAHAMESPEHVAKRRPHTPAALATLVMQCLEKRPADRPQSAYEVIRELDGVVVTPAGSATIAALASVWRRRLTSHVRQVLPVAIVGAIGIGTYVVWRSQQTTTPPAVHLVAPLPPGVYLPMDTEHPVLALAPDGSRIVFVGEEHGIRRLYVRGLGEPEAKPMAGTEDAASPFFSPDGRWLAFIVSNGALKKVPADGGVPVVVHATTGPSVSRGLTWYGADSLAYAASANSGLFRGSIGGERVRTFGDWVWLTQDATAPYAWPHALPDGRHILFTDNADTSVDRARIKVASVRTGAINLLVNGGTSPRYSPTGHLLFLRQNALYAAPFVARRAEVTGPEQILTDGVIAEPNGAAHFAVGANSTLAYVAGGSISRESEVVWVDRRGNATTLLEKGREFLHPRLSPDGRRLALTSSTGSNVDVWIFDIGRRALERFTTHPGEDFNPVWSPDGERLAFASETDEANDNGGPSAAWSPIARLRPEPLTRSPGIGNWEFPTSWSPDGRWIAVTKENPAAIDVALIATSEPHTAIPFAKTSAAEKGAAFSPDSRWIVYTSDESGRDEVYVQPIPGPGARVQISTNGGIEPVWSRDGRELFYREGDKLMVVKRTPGPSLSVSSPSVVFEGHFDKTQYGGWVPAYDVSPDGQRFVMVRRKNVVRPTEIHVVLNWPEALGVRGSARR